MWPKLRRFSARGRTIPASRGVLVHLRRDVDLWERAFSLWPSFPGLICLFRSVAQTGRKREMETREVI